MSDIWGRCAFLLNYESKLEMSKYKCRGSVRSPRSLVHDTHVLPRVPEPARGGGGEGRGGVRGRRAGGGGGHPRRIQQRSHVLQRRLQQVVPIHLHTEHNASRTHFDRFECDGLNLGLSRYNALVERAGRRVEHGPGSAGAAASTRRRWAPARAARPTARTSRRRRRRPPPRRSRCARTAPPRCPATRQQIAHLPFIPFQTQGRHLSVYTCRITHHFFGYPLEPLREVIENFH